jgi:hypothetical protein
VLVKGAFFYDDAKERARSALDQHALRLLSMFGGLRGMVLNSTDIVRRHFGRRMRAAELCIESTRDAEHFA